MTDLSTHSCGCTPKNYCQCVISCGGQCQTSNRSSIKLGSLWSPDQDVLPDRVIAESGGAPNLRGLFSGTKGDGKLFSFVLFGGGGMGARPDRDGLPCTGFPSNSTFGSTEVIESVTPLLFWKKEMVRD